ncbi:MAG: sugar dehydratase [Planctomycetes bacterium RBG_13_44_8b]|nr:MAG: sugar dehydratase [Planctomycetes bacterium RBG_13_44_8b]
MNKKFWENKKVLITGFEGFLGSNLTKALLSSDADIVGLDIKVNRKSTILTLAEYEKIKIIKGNVANYNLMKKIISDFEIEVVFHLAAEAIVVRSHQNPLRTFSSNIQGTWSVLEACRNNKTVKSIVVASSDKAYGSHRKLPYEETSPLMGNHPYDVSKSCADLIAYAYFHSYGLPVVVTRCGNIYGPGDFNFSRIVPDAIRCTVLDKILYIRSDGKFTRDYAYVDDIVNGYTLLAEKMRKENLAGEAFNLSDENPITVIELVGTIYRIANKEPNYKILNKAKYEIKNQYLCSRKARKILGWKPKYSLEEGLRNAIEWYRNYLCHQ